MVQLFVFKEQTCWLLEVCRFCLRVVTETVKVRKKNRDAQRKKFTTFMSIQFLQPSYYGATIYP